VTCRVTSPARRVELGLLTHEVSIPQTASAGAEAGVDFGEVYSTIAAWSEVWMFLDAT